MTGIVCSHQCGHLPVVRCIRRALAHRRRYEERERSVIRYRILIQDNKCKDTNPLPYKCTVYLCIGTSFENLHTKSKYLTWSACCSILCLLFGGLAVRVLHQSLVSLKFQRNDNHVTKCIYITMFLQFYTTNSSFRLAIHLVQMFLWVRNFLFSARVRV